MNRLLRNFLINSWLLTLAHFAYSQEQVSISRIAGGFKFDGIVNDACWQNTKPLSMVMHTPTFGYRPTEKSEIMICYDNSYLYIGARLFDSEPSKCSSHQRKGMKWKFPVKS